MGREVEGRFKREGTRVCLWLIQGDVRQKPTQYCKAIVLQLKKIFKGSYILKGDSRDSLILHALNKHVRSTSLIHANTSCGKLKNQYKTHSLPSETTV